MSAERKAAVLAAFDAREAAIQAAGRQWNETNAATDAVYNAACNAARDELDAALAQIEIDHPEGATDDRR